MLEKKHYAIGETYQENTNLVVGVHYGSEGIIPCYPGCSTSCVSSSGDSLCGGYIGHNEVEVDGTKLYIIRCQESVKCINCD